MRNLMTNTAVAFASVALTAGIVAFADPANASPRVESHSVVVPLADLDLHTDAGRASAEQRIRKAADAACGYPEARDLGANQCNARARDTAEQALDRIASR